MTTNQLTRLASIFMLAFGSLAFAQEPMQLCDITFSNGVMLEAVPVAKTQAQQEQGLSKRHDIGNGMLFTWSEAEPRTFWMRDTWAALDIGFFDADATLFAIKTMQPDNDTRHRSIEPARYALELAKGQYAKHNISIGSSIIKLTCLKPNL